LQGRHFLFWNLLLDRGFGCLVQNLLKIFIISRGKKEKKNLDGCERRRPVKCVPPLFLVRSNAE
jgi:hypothetical protein